MFINLFKPKKDVSFKKKPNNGILAMYQGFYSARVMLPVTYIKELLAWRSLLAWLHHYDNNRTANNAFGSSDYLFIAHLAFFFTSIKKSKACDLQICDNLMNVSANKLGPHSLRDFFSTTELFYLAG